MWEWTKCYSNTLLPIHNDINTNISLKYRKPTRKLAQKIISEKFNEIMNGILTMQNRTEEVLGFDFSRKDLVVLNRLSIGHMLHNWGLKPSPVCDYGHKNQTTTHTVDECSIRKLHEGMKELHRSTTGTVQWLNSPGHAQIWRKSAKPAQTISITHFLLVNILFILICYFISLFYIMLYPTLYYIFICIMNVI